MVNPSKRSIEILCTLGPASLNDWTLARLTDLGVNLFRINLSHTKLKDLKNVIRFIQKRTNVPICLDSEGAQIRTGSFKSTSVVLKENSLIRIPRKEAPGTASSFNLYPLTIVDAIETGDFLSLDFNSVLAQVVDKDRLGLTVRVITGGVLGQNKAVSVDRDILLSALTPKDRQAIRLGLKMGVRHVALSFANRAKDVEEMRSLVTKDTAIISKIESCRGVDNLEDIARRSNAILIDRGDLSRELAIEQIPRAQKEIIARAKKCRTKVYVATNLLESMTKVSQPTRAEVNDIFNTLADGADGLVLAAETAIGSFPVPCAMMVTKVIKQFQDFSKQKIISAAKLRRQHSILLIEPHGGTLIDRTGTNYSAIQLNGMKKLSVDLTTLLDCEQIAVGTYSPLEGFMTHKELESVLKTYRMPSGVIWPLPVVLQISKKAVHGLKRHESVAITLDGSKDIYAVLHIEEIYSYDMEDFCQRTFGTNDDAHPGVKLFKGRGNHFIGGKVDLIKRTPSEFMTYEMTPKQTRAIFENKSWARIVGFHTRNVPHRAHEYIQLLAFERFHCDGILIHPLIGPKKKGDYSAEVILKSYEQLIQKYYPKGKVLLSAFSNYSRYCGPREAVFTALCRKNFGCTHFIVGRDHTGVAGFYQPHAAHQLFKELGDLGIKPVFFKEVRYCRKCGHYVEDCGHTSRDVLHISGTEGRRMIQSREIPPAWFMRSEISKLILSQMKQQKEIFFT